ncbi:Gfo/Idh/MocA family oxidoreductase [Massilia agilis]|uniref:Gfo/Idh/MocA family oxidoreductase n=1 Tax=Massilia agilis TaxID=1811226 RepID=A0ABT2D819_9BURK|nr:Gfo/Idh/MocA family oxidoreductase [Massilia agilis]MCS0807440.1 Gfo/Idh/MocA family oxidoreductase [Massilia agilis]
MSNSNQVLLVGAGPMAVDYAKVLTALGRDIVVVGRSDASAAAFEEKTGIPAIPGGLDAYLERGGTCPELAIVAVGVEALAQTTCRLLASGVRRVLLEKPGALTRAEILAVDAASRETGAQVLIAYNRRFYASTLRALELIEEQGGVQSMHFEFTEWGHVIAPLVKAPGVKPAWLLGNSTHVIDLAFYLAGQPQVWHGYTSGSLDWHPASAVFAGAGRTERGALFSYQANWAAPGRWGVEVLTGESRLIFRPMETLQLMRKGSVAIEPVAIDDRLDKQFKPGLYVQVSRFLEGATEGFCSVQEQAAVWDVYCGIAGYQQA